MRRLLAGFLPSPPLGLRLWLTLVGLVVGILNLVLLAELWPHTPAAAVVVLVLVWLLMLALLPQAAEWAWRWLRTYAGPRWVRVLATALFLSGAGVVRVGWLAVLLGGPLFFFTAMAGSGAAFCVGSLIAGSRVASILPAHLVFALCRTRTLTLSRRPSCSRPWGARLARFN